MRIYIWILLVLGLINRSESIDCDKTPKTSEARLKQFLFCNYDKTVRPVSVKSNSTVLTLRLLVKTFDFSDISQILTINSWTPLGYSDKNLAWNPQSYDGLESIIEPSSTLWMPDLSLYNSETGRGENACSVSECRISSRGRVMCVQPCSYKAICESNFERWPYDRQNCSLTLGTWLSPGEHVSYEINRTTIVSESHLLHKEWRLVSTKVTMNTGSVSSIPNETYPSLDFNFIIERHSEFDVAIILVPALIIILISLVSLWLDLESFDRLILIIINLTINFSFIQQVSWYVPRNGEVCPTVVLFFRNSMIMITITLIETFSIRTIGKTERMVPMWIDTINVFFTTSPLSSYFTLSKMADQQSIPIDGETLLKESQNRLDGPTDRIKWQQFSKIIDRLLFLIFFVIFVIMLVTLVPESYGSDTSLEAVPVESP